MKNRAQSHYEGTESWSRDQEEEEEEDGFNNGARKRRRNC